MKLLTWILLLSAVLGSCTSGNETSIRKIPCEDTVTYHHQGNLDGTFLSLYYAVDYSDSIPRKEMKAVADSVFDTIDLKKYSHISIMFYKESSKLRQIRNCEITDSHNINSGEHISVAQFSYDANSNSFMETRFDKEGRIINISDHSSPKNVAVNYQDKSGTSLKPVGYVNDFENDFSITEEMILDSLIRNFENRTTIQVAIITLDTSMVASDSLDAFTLRLAREWGVGQKDKDNGVMIGISLGHGRIRIQNGYGIEKVLSDSDTQMIIDTAFLPYYKKSEYYKGTLYGLTSLMKVLEQRSKQ